MKQSYPKSFKFETPEQSPGFLLWQLSNTWQRNINKALKPHNLTHVQFVILANIYWFMEHESLPTQTQLSKQSKTDPVVTSNVLKTLSKKSFIKKKEGKDQRKKQIALTQKGKDILIPAITDVESFDETFFKNLDVLTDVRRMIDVMID